MGVRKSHDRPLVSVIVPTHGRQTFLLRAVESVLEQTADDLEVVVVDDASDPPVQIPTDPRVRIIRLDENRGIAGALTAGAQAARGQWIAHVDDDDVLLPRMLEVSLHAAEASDLPGPVVVTSGVELVDTKGRVMQRRIPPTRPRGNHYSLEDLESGRAYETRNTMVAPRALLERVGYWDARFRSSARNDLFLRLNPISSILGLAEITYRQTHHQGPRVSTNADGKHESFLLLEAKHLQLFVSHPRRYAHYLAGDAIRLAALGRYSEAAESGRRAVRTAPTPAIARITRHAFRSTARRARTAAVRVTTRSHER